MSNNEEWKQVFIDGKPYKNKNGYNRIDIRDITQDNQKKRKTM